MHLLHVDAATITVASEYLSIGLKASFDEIGILVVIMRRFHAIEDTVAVLPGNPFRNGLRQLDKS